MKDPEKFDVTVTEAACVLRCHPEHVRRLVRAGMLVATKPGKRYFISRQSLDRYLAGDGNMRLALEWLALVGNKKQAPRLVSLLRRTFHLPLDDIAEMLRVWGLEETRARELVEARRGDEEVGDVQATAAAAGPEPATA